jgi:hypothetical protein
LGAVATPPEFPDVSPDAFLTLLALGFGVAVVGHIYRSRPVIALGVTLIVVAVIVLPLITLARLGI